MHKLTSWRRVSGCLLILLISPAVLLFEKRMWKSPWRTVLVVEVWAGRVQGCRRDFELRHTSSTNCELCYKDMIQINVNTSTKIKLKKSKDHAHSGAQHWGSNWPSHNALRYLVVAGPMTPRSESQIYPSTAHFHLYQHYATLLVAVWYEWKRITDNIHS